MRTKLSVLSLAITLTGCGGGDDIPAAKVLYDGTTLVIRGVRYDRSPDNTIVASAVCEGQSTCYKGGEILISVADQAAFLEMSKELDVRLTSGSSQGLTVAVPIQFERQWARSLASEHSIQSASVEPVSVN